MCSLSVVCILLGVWKIDIYYNPIGSSMICVGITIRITENVFSSCTKTSDLFRISDEETCCQYAVCKYLTLIPHVHLSLVYLCRCHYMFERLRHHLGYQR